MNSIKKNWYAILIVIIFAIIPVVSFADTINTACNPSDGKICNPITQNSVTGFIQSLLTGVLRIGLPIVALAIIYSGFLFVAARGSAEKLTKAKDALLYTLIGAAILLGSWAIAILISETVRSL